ncbi:serine/threonine protein kinase [Caballeronia sp. S22]|uniref:serine/threonine protein kinase n=1 Tax=Caballeronia sp. S22 TaxID=3137182 RepID=UPI003530ECAB
MNSQDTTRLPQPLSDDYGNRHFRADEVARGGQGVVFRTRDVDLAIKQPLDASGQPDRHADLRQRFQDIRLLPLPSRIPISLPLVILRDEPGYVMRLLNDMKSFSSFDLNGKIRNELKVAQATLPHWLAGVPDGEQAWRLFHYALEGSTRRRLAALAKCASILARLHCAGLVYGDISSNNAFVGQAAAPEVWLIDADNLRFEQAVGGSAVVTPGYGAPEVMQGVDASRPRTDCWSFAVMAFRTLALCHPFIGRKVTEPDDDADDWDAEPSDGSAAVDLYAQAYAGHFPFIDDEQDASNASQSGLQRSLVATPAMRLLFQETFGAGRQQPHRRPAMFFWAMELSRAFDRSLVCRECKMSHFVDSQAQCPYCGASRPAFVRVRTSRWECVLVDDAKVHALPHRLFHPFSLEHNADAAYHAVIDFASRTGEPERDTQDFPAGLTFEFVEAGA